MRGRPTPIRSTLAVLALLALNAAAAESQRVVVSCTNEKQLVVYALDDASGTLKLESQTPTSAGAGALCFNSKGDHLYVVLKQSGALAAYQMGKTTAPVLLGEVSIGAGAAFLSMHPSGKYLLASSYSDGQVTVNRINADGTLSAKPLQSLKVDERAHSIVLDPTGRYAFVSHTIPNAITQFVFDAETGLLSPNDPPQLKRVTQVGPRHFCFHPQLPMAYGSDEGGCSITAYQFNAQSGCLSVVETLSSLPEGEVEGKKSASDIRMHPSGKFVYVANRGPDTIAGFKIDPVSGRLTPLQQTPVEPVPRSFNLSPDGRFLIAAGERSGKLRVFRIQPDGRLELTQTLDTNASPWWVEF